MNVQTLGIGRIIALLVFLLAVVFVYMQQVSSPVGGLIAALALAVALP